MVVNNITRLLDAAHARYQAFEIPVEKISAVDTALLLSVAPELVYKTIVIIVPKGKPVLCVVPGNYEVDLKSVANILGEKKVHIATHADAEKLTGLQTGGISPLALVNRGFRTIIDTSIRQHQEIHISGGQRGLNIRINVEDLMTILHPQIGLIS